MGDCSRLRPEAESDPAEMAARYGAETPVLDWRKRLVCSRPAGRYGGDRNEAVICGASAMAEMIPTASPFVRSMPCAKPTRK